MTAPRELESALSAWLRAAAEHRAPAATLDAVIDRSRSMRPLPRWRAMLIATPMQREGVVLVGSRAARRLVALTWLLLIGLAAMLALAAAALLPTLFKETQFVYAANPGTLPSGFCDQARDCRDGLAGWPGGRFLLMQGPDGSVPTILVETTWPSTILDYRISPTGSHVAYLRSQVNFPASCLELVVVDRAAGTEKVVAETWGLLGPSFAWWPGDGQLVFSAAGRCSPGGNGVFAYDVTSGTLRRVLDLGAVAPSEPPDEPPEVIAWHPDGRRILIAGLPSGEAQIVAVDGSSPPVPIDCGCTAWTAAWSPDASRLLLETTTGRLLVGAGDGTGFELVAELGEAATWSPDGRSIVFLGGPPGLRPRGYARDVVVVAADGGGRRMVARTGVRSPSIRTPARWSPDGDRLYWSDHAGTWSIRADGTDQRKMSLPAQIDLEWVELGVP